MSNRIDPALMHELKAYGAVGIEKCFNCGNCTAICPLTSDKYAFPRNMIRLTQVGMKKRMQSSLDPWLCYYCGDCSETCPKQAEPGESMMAMRRWLTAQYDWTGLAHKFYTSKAWEFGSIILLGALVFMLIAVLHGPIDTEHVALNTFAPLHIVHAADWIMAGLLVFFISSNVLRMYQMTMLRGHNPKIPFIIYITEAWNLVFHAVTQRRWATCAADEKDEKIKKGKQISWIIHMLLASGYGLMLILIVFFLSWFQTDEIYSLYHPQRWLGYYATIVLLLGAGRALWGRIQQEVQMHRFSHPSDWIFPVLLLAVTLTGILQHIFRYADLPLLTYYTYAIHLAFTAPMLILEVPFGKWAHLYYRPLAIYFQVVKEKASQYQEKQAAEAVASAAD